jgi:trehalose 6-phosphate phosphatase
MMMRLTTDCIDAALKERGRVLVAVDFDGTLCRIAKFPDMVFLPRDTRDALEQLSAMPGVTVVVVSGRGMPDLQDRVGLPLIYAANHGLEIRGAGLDFTHPVASRSVGLLVKACDTLDGIVGKWRGAWVERKDLSATVHFRNVAADEQHRVAMAVRRTMGSYGNVFSLRSGRRALEIRPRCDWHKGAAVEYIGQRIGFGGAAQVCFGDDITDEPMFKAFPDALTVRVGWHAGSAARFYVDDTAAVRCALVHVTQRLEHRGTGASQEYRLQYAG